MAIINNYPYSDFENINLDWLIKTMMKALEDYAKLAEDTKLSIAELENIINNEIVQYIQQYVDDHLAQFIMTASYDEPTRTIELKPEVTP